MFYMPPMMHMAATVGAPLSYHPSVHPLNINIPTQQGAWMFCPAPTFQTPDDAVGYIPQEDKWDPQLLKSVRLFKTELCRAWGSSGRCKFGSSCQYAHGEHELRSSSARARQSKKKTEPCVMFARYGSCAYGGGCHFIHDSAAFEEPTFKSKVAPTSTTTANSSPNTADSFRWPSVSSLEEEPLNRQNYRRLPVFRTITE